MNHDDKYRLIEKALSDLNIALFGQAFLNEKYEG
tara:strand:+ start:742 stop:843 length:102 start_codon:yes stop_codon:yes gene_type:complete